MERLTEWINDNEPFAIMRQDDLKIGHKTCINKLAAYEDTGLTPEEILQNKSIINDLTRTVCAKDKKIKKLSELLKKAVDDFRILDSACPTDIDCVDCPLYNSQLDKCVDKWRYAEEAQEVLKDDV